MRSRDGGYMGTYFFILFIFLMGTINLVYVINMNSSRRSLEGFSKYQAMLFAESGINIIESEIRGGGIIDSIQTYEYPEGRIEIHCEPLNDEVLKIISWGCVKDKKSKIEISIRIKEEDQSFEILDKVVR